MSFTYFFALCLPLIPINYLQCLSLRTDLKKILVSWRKLTFTATTLNQDSTFHNLIKCS